MRTFERRPRATLEMAGGLGTVEVRPLKLSEVQAIREAIAPDAPATDFILAMLEHSVVDPAGDQVLSAADWDDYCGEYREDGRAVIDAVVRENGLAPEAVAKN